MNESVDSLSFAALAPDGEVDSLAYWLDPCDVAVLRDTDATGITQAMAYQYEIEEQAGVTGTVIPEDDDWWLVL